MPPPGWPESDQLLQTLLYDFFAQPEMPGYSPPLLACTPSAPTGIQQVSGNTNASRGGRECDWACTHFLEL